MHQQQDAVGVPSSRGSTISRQRAGPDTPSDKSTHSVPNERLPPILPPPSSSFRYRIPNGELNQSRAFQSTNYRASPTSPKRYIPKSMSTTTTVKRPLVHGGPIVSNGTPPSHAERNISTMGGKRVR